MPVGLMQCSAEEIGRSASVNCSICRRAGARAARADCRRRVSRGQDRLRGLQCRQRTSFRGEGKGGYNISRDCQCQHRGGETAKEVQGVREESQGSQGKSEEPGWRDAANTHSDPGAAEDDLNNLFDSATEGSQPKAVGQNLLAS